MVDFYANWCGPCRMLTPMLAQVSQETGVQLLKVNVDEVQSLASQYGISALPTVVGVKNGREHSRFMGLKDARYLKQFANSLKE